MADMTKVLRIREGESYSERLSPDNIEKVIWKTLIAMQGQAALLVPVDKGLLRDSLTIATNQNKEAFGVRAMFGEEIDAPTQDNQGILGTNVEYAAAVEFGRPDIPNYPAQPYLRPTVTWMRYRGRSITAKAMRDMFKEYSIRHPHKTTEVKS